MRLRRIEAKMSSLKSLSPSLSPVCSVGWLEGIGPCDEELCSGLGYAGNMMDVLGDEASLETENAALERGRSCWAGRGMASRSTSESSSVVSASSPVVASPVSSPDSAWGIVPSVLWRWGFVCGVARRSVGVTGVKDPDLLPKGLWRPGPNVPFSWLFEVSGRRAPGIGRA